MFDWMRRKPDLTQGQRREARLKRLAKVLEVPEQPFLVGASYQPRTGFARKTLVGEDCSNTFRIRNRDRMEEGDRC